MYRFICIIITIAVMLSGCGTNDKNKPQDESYKIESPADPIYNPSENKNLMMYAIRPDTLNPILTQFKANRDIFTLVFEPLVAIKSDFTAEFRLARSGEIKDNGRVHEITLREGITWHDGADFSPKDVKYTVETIKDAGESCYYYQNVKDIKNITTEGKSKVIFELETENAGFLNLLTFPIIKRDSGDFEPIGTGMYKFRDYSLPSEYILVKNEDYFGAKAKVNTVKLSILPDISSIANGFKINLIDASFVRNEDLNKYTNSSNIGTKITNTLKYTFLSVDNQNPLFKDSEFKKIIKDIVATEKITTDLLPKNAVLAHTPVHPKSQFALHPEKEEEESIKKRLSENGCKLADNGYRYKKIEGTGSFQLAFNLLINGDNPSKVIVGDYIKSALENFGISVKIVKATNETYTDYAMNRKYDMILAETEISEDYNLSFMLGTDAPLNIGKYSSEKMDELLFKARSTSDENKRIAYMKEIQNVFLEDMPHIPLYFAVDKLMYNKLRFENIVSENVGGGYFSANEWTLK